MKSNELSIGSLFYPINRSGEIHLPDQIAMKVISIELFEVKAILASIHIPYADESQIFTYDIKDLSPIPFDSDWLFKLNKFSIDNNIMLDERIGKSITFNHIGSSNGYRFELSINPHFKNVELPIKYVHQVQSLFQILTGIFPFL